MLQRLVDFVERLSLDEKMYWRVPRLKGPQPVEIVYERTAKPTVWRVKLGEDRDWLPVRGDDMSALLKAAAIDMTYLERQIGVSLLTQAVFADLFLEKIRVLFGEQVVKKSISDAKAFFDEVGNKTTQLASETPDSRERPASQAAPAARPLKTEPRAKLKLVHSDGRAH